MNLKSLEKRAIEMMAIKGNEKGHNYMAILDYIRKEKGNEGIDAIKRRLRELGCNLNIDAIENQEWYPVGVLNLIIVVAREQFDWSDDDIFKMGYFSTTLSFSVKIFSKYFISLTKFLSMLSNIYNKLYDFGKLEVIEVNTENKYYIIKLERYGKFPPETCIYFMGAFKKTTELVVKGKDVKVQETECTHKGSNHHQYRISWK